MVFIASKPKAERRMPEWWEEGKEALESFYFWNIFKRGKCNKIKGTEFHDPLVFGGRMEGCCLYQQMVPRPRGHKVASRPLSGLQKLAVARKPYVVFWDSSINFCWMFGFGSYNYSILREKKGVCLCVCVLWKGEGETDGMGRVERGEWQLLLGTFWLVFLQQFLCAILTMALKDNSSAAATPVTEVLLIQKFSSWCVQMHGKAAHV